MRTKDKCSHLASLSHSSQAKTLQNRRDYVTLGRSPQVFFVLCKVAWSRKARRNKDRALTTVMPLPSGRFPGSPTQVLLLFYLIVIFYCLVCAFLFFDITNDWKQCARITNVVIRKYTSICSKNYFGFLESPIVEKLAALTQGYESGTFLSGEGQHFPASRWGRCFDCADSVEV